MPQPKSTGGGQGADYIMVQSGSLSLRTSPNLAKSPVREGLECTKMHSWVLKKTTTIPTVKNAWWQSVPHAGKTSLFGILNFVKFVQISVN